MITRNIKALLMVISLSVIQTNVWAHLKTDKTIINSSTGNAVVSVSFPTPVSGDLYVATLFNGELVFFADNGAKLTTEVQAFTKNSTFAEDKVILSIASQGIPPNTYPLYQVATVAGKSPLDFSNWIGGPSGLSELQFRINLPADATSVAAVPTPTPTLTPSGCNTEKVRDSDAKVEKSNEEDDCEPTPTPTPAPLDGKALYNSQCASCHGSNPKANREDILKGKDTSKIREAIKKNKGNMGVLNGISDANLQAIANYLKTF